MRLCRSGDASRVALGARAEPFFTRETESNLPIFALFILNLRNISAKLIPSLSSEGYDTVSGFSLFPELIGIAQHLSYGINTFDIYSIYLPKAIVFVITSYDNEKKEASVLQARVQLCKHCLKIPSIFPQFLSVAHLITATSPFRGQSTVPSLVTAQSATQSGLIQSPGRK